MGSRWPAWISRFQELDDEVGPPDALQQGLGFGCVKDRLRNLDV